MRKNISDLVLSFLLLQLWIAPLSFALDPTKQIKQYNHTMWRNEDGLPQNSVQAIAQTNDGYIWLGTHEGVVRFDGIQFTVFDRNNTPEINHNSITSLAGSKDGSLWIGTEDGLTRMQRGNFFTYTTTHGLSYNFVTGLFEDAEGKIWIATQGGGLSVWKDDKFTNYTTKEGLPSDFLTSVRGANDGSIYIGSTAGLTKFKNGIFRTYTTADGLVADLVRCILADGDSVVWAGTNIGLSKFKNGKWTTLTTKNGLLHNWVRSIFRDREGSLWLGTSAGLNRIWNNQISKYTSRDRLSGEFVASIYEDFEGNLWTGTLSGGLDLFNSGRFIVYGEKEGLGRNEVRPVYQTHDGAVWVGTNGGGITRIKDGVFKTFTTADGLPYDGIRGICEDEDGAIWIATSGGGICRMKGKDITTWTTKDGLGNNYVYAFLLSSDRTLWIGTRGGGLSAMKGGKIKTFTTEDGLASNIVRTLLERRDGSIWAGTNNGLTRFKDGKLTSITKENGLSYDVVYSLFEDEDSVLWIGTYGGGLIRFKDDSFTTYTTKEGLFDNGVFQILEDEQKYFWMTCNRGIYRVSKKELNDFAEGKIKSVHSTVFGISDGLRTTKCNGSSQPAGIRTRDGKLWIPTLMGVAIVDPTKLQKNRLPPPVIIESFTFDQQPETIDSTVHIGPGEGEFEFQYTGLSYISPRRVSFKYKLEGFDKDWIEAGIRRTAYYTNIPPGEYTFKVIACNNDGVWNYNGTTMKIILAAHFYQTSWFYVLVLISVLFTGFGAVRLRIMSIQKREKELVQIVDDRTKNLQLEIGERKRAEENLQQSLSLLQGTLESTADGILVISKKGIITNFNDQFVRMWNIEKSLLQEGNDRKVLELMMGLLKNPHESLKKVDELNAHPAADSFDILELKDGRIFEQYSHPQRIEGEPVGRVWSFRDITERQQAEEQRQESEERYRRLVEFSPDAIAVHNDGEFVYVNPATVKLLGAQDESQLLGISMIDIIHPDYKETVRQEILRGMKNRMALPSIEEKFIRFDGTIIDVEVTSIPIIYQGQPAMQVVARDTTEQKKLRDQILQSQKIQSIGTLAGGIAHDFNNILGIIIGYTSLLERRREDEQKHTESVTAIAQAAERGASLVRQILTFARKTDVSFLPVSIPELISELLSMLKQTFPKTITFTEDYLPDLPDILADRIQIHQAILNLCVNARDAMPHGGTISFKVEKKTRANIRERFSSAEYDNYLCINVIDTGEGMDEATRQRAFDPFFTTKDKGKGTGLGLSVVYGIMQAHHGFVDVISQVGISTTFSLFLPIQQILNRADNQSPQIETTQAQLPRGTETILLVEDEYLLLDMIQTTLKSKGYNVITATDGLEAVDIYTQHRDEIALVLTDLGLPKLNGMDAFMKLREINPEVKVVLASGFFEPDKKIVFQQLGIKGFIQKPYLPNQVLRIVREVLDTN